MTQRDLDEAVARLRAASLRNDPDGRGSGARSRAPARPSRDGGAGALDPTAFDAHAHVVSGVSSLPAGMDTQPRTDWKSAAAAGGRRGAAPCSAAPVQHLAGGARPRRGAAARGPSRGSAGGRLPVARQLPTMFRLPGGPRRGRSRRRTPGGHPAARSRAAGPGARRGRPPQPHRRSRNDGFRRGDGRRRRRAAQPKSPASSGRDCSSPGRLPAARARSALRPQARAEELATPKSAALASPEAAAPVRGEILGWILVPVILFGLYWAVRRWARDLRAVDRRRGRRHAGGMGSPCADRAPIAERLRRCRTAPERCSVRGIRWPAFARSASPAIRFFMRAPIGSPIVSRENGVTSRTFSPSSAIASLCFAELFSSASSLPLPSLVRSSGSSRGTGRPVQTLGILVLHALRDALGGRSG